MAHSVFSGVVFTLLGIVLGSVGSGKEKADFSISGGEGKVVDGRRQLASFEGDSYGPLPYPETVQRFVRDEVGLLLERQREDGSFEISAGKKTEAGGTVDSITLASLGGYSLRKHVEVNPVEIEKAISKALDFVVYMVRSGKLRNGRDAAWRYAYSFRFLVNEYPHIKDERKKELVEDAAIFLLYGLKDLQQGTKGQRSQPTSWRQHSSPGIRVDDDKLTGRAVVSECPVDSPAYKAGIRVGDHLLMTGGMEVHTKLRYEIQQAEWKGGDVIKFEVSRGGKPLQVEVLLPPRFPGDPGFFCRNLESGGVVVGEFGPLGDTTAGRVKVGDRVLKIDGEVVAHTKFFDERSWYSGQEFELELKRGGELRTVELVCGPTKPGTLGAVLAGGLDQTMLDGFALQKLSGNSCLRKAGLKVGDRLFQIGDQRIMNRRHFTRIENDLWGGQEIAVVYFDAQGINRKTAKIKTTARSYDDWLKGYHGLTISNARVRGATIMKVDPGSPADVAGCRKGDVIKTINDREITSPRAGLNLLSGLLAGQQARVSIERDGKDMDLEFEIHRPADSPWISNSIERGGGWVYYTYVRGGTVFLSSDILRELIRAREVFPFHIPEEMIREPFMLLSKLRWKQPNSKVESYRYDGGGSFGGVRDIRGDVGRLGSAELSCLMYSESGLAIPKGMVRTHEQLGLALKEWLRHRGILELARSGGHQKFSIAPWYLPYSYLTTLEAADFLTGDDELKESVKRSALKGYFQYCKLAPIEDLGGRVGWQIGYYKKKQLLRTCLLLDGLATMKHLYQSSVTVNDPALAEAMVSFRDSRYGEAYRKAQGARAEKNEVDTLVKAIRDRFDSRVSEIKRIHQVYHQDALRYLKEMEPDFAGFPEWAKGKELISNWEKTNAD